MGGRWGWIGLAGLGLAVAVAIELGRGTPSRRPATASPPDPLARIAPSVAYDTALARSLRGRSDASLAYYRRALVGVREDFWQLHCNYGSALYNVTLEQTVHRGVRMPLVRSSWERMALVREAILEQRVAEHLTRTPAERATVITLRGQLAHVFGFPWETLVSYREAQFADPSQHALAARADGYQWSMEHPLAPSAAAASPGDSGIAPAR